MGYYGMRGDYYRGDYYRGDPGLLGSIGKFLGGAAKGLVGAATGLLTGGPGGAIAGAARALLPKVTPTAATPGVGIMALPQLPPIGVGQVGPLGGQQGLINVQTFTQGGRPIVKTLDTATGKFVGKRRRMNVTNSRALRRALRRVAGFGKLAARARRDIARAASAVGAHRRPASGGSRGVITRSEAARALKR